MGDDGSWRTQAFRQSVVSKIEEAIRQSGINPSRNSLEMENDAFEKAKSNVEYLGYVARLILRIREMNTKNDGSWRTQALRQSVVSKIEEAIRQSGMNPARNSLEMENYILQKAKTKEEYLGYVAKFILYIHEMTTKNGAGMGVPGPNQGPPGVPDLINALQTLAIQETQNPLMTMGGPQQGPMGAQQHITATNLLQTLNRSPGDDGSWRTQAFRQSVVSKIEETIQQSGMNLSRNSLEIENHAFQKSKTKEQYLGYVASFILHVRGMSTKNDGSWRTQALRQSVVSKIEEAIQQSGVNPSRSSLEMENFAFQKAKTKEEYLAYVAKFILYVHEMNTKNGAGMGVPGPNQGPPVFQSQ